MQLTKKMVFTPDAPKPVGPYSQAIICYGFVFVSGQIPIDPQTQKIVEANIEKQTVQVLENLKKILESINLTLSDVVKTTVFLNDLKNFKQFNAVGMRHG